MNENRPEEFFTGVVLDLWRKAMTPEQTQLEAAFLKEALAAPAGGRLLDVPCGNGRLSLALARDGFRLTGVDIAGEFIEEARALSAAIVPPIEWRQADMRDLPWEAAFDGAFCFGNSFGYLDHGGMSAFVAAVSRALKPGARFALDPAGAAAESILPNLEARSWYRVADILMLIENEYRAEESRLETRYTFVQNGREETRVHSQWVFTLAEIRRLLEAAGLRPIAAYGSLDRKPYQCKDRLLYCVAEKSA